MRIGIVLRIIPALVQPEHMHEHEVRVEFLAELALAIPPELAPSLVLARSLALPDLVCALDGGHPPRPCSLVLYYLGCPTQA